MPGFGTIWKAKEILYKIIGKLTVLHFEYNPRLESENWEKGSELFQLVNWEQGIHSRDVQTLV